MKSTFLSNIHHAYAQTDGTYKFPNSLEGDMLKQAKKEIMKKTIETNTTINVKIGDHEFNLTKEEAEELYNSLKNSLGKNDTITPSSPLKDYGELNKKYDKCNPPNPYPQNPYYPPAPKPYDIWCEQKPHEFWAKNTTHSPYDLNP